MIIATEIGTKPLAELVKQVQAGNEVLLTESNKPVAKIITASQEKSSSNITFQVRSFKGRRALTPDITQGEVADEMFRRR